MFNQKIFDICVGCDNIPNFEAKIQNSQNVCDEENIIKHLWKLSSIICKTLKCKSNYQIHSFVTFIFKVLNLVYFARVQCSVYTFKSRLNLGCHFLVFLHLSVRQSGVVHTFTTARDLVISDNQREPAKAKRKARGKSFARRSIRKAHICALCDSGGFRGRPDDERLMKAYFRFVWKADVINSRHYQINQE
ncbi:Hypothetical_protein [Hexamita inflata]|uniref:Hypothetical_protein n=1 Tax=Hexamita inflata TaxID=28002 RepID=A0AA86RIH2_9EUKA|nr:Hypothetical protein HINF_LOCUS60399 [Hexamita inflata]